MPLRQCRHGFRVETEEDCLFSASHWTRSPDDDPKQVMGNWCQKMGDASVLALQTTSSALNVLASDRLESCSNARIDFFGVSELGPDCPLFVFIHGGYWQEGSRQLSRTMVPLFVASGAKVAVVGYGLAPKYRLHDMVDQVAAALVWIERWSSNNATKGWYLCGHSAGGQLAALGLVGTGGVELRRLQGLLLLSAVTELSGLRGTQIGRPLGLTEEDIDRLSPINRIEDIVSKLREGSTVWPHNPDAKRLIVGLAELEAPALIAQNHAFVQELGRKGGNLPTQFAELPGATHFSMIEHLGDPGSSLTSRVLAWMRLQANAN